MKESTYAEVKKWLKEKASLWYGTSGADSHVHAKYLDRASKVLDEMDAELATMPGYEKKTC